MPSQPRGRPPLPSALRLLAAGALAAAAPAHAFTFSFNQTNPQTCEPVDVRWAGGSPPFRLMIVPAFDYPFTIDLDNSTWDAATATGAYVWQANYPDTIGGFVAVMSDAAGLATGGVSAIMSLAEGGDSSACEIRPEASDFYFYLDPQDGEVEQCTQLGISWGDNATDPVTIVGVIPQGDAFILSTEDAVNSRNWDVNIAAGTTYILTLLDGGSIGNGGSSNFMTTTKTNDTSCMDAAAPSRTPGSTWGTPDGVAATTAAPEATASASSSAAPSSSSSGALSAGEIAGAVIGGLVGFALIQVGLVWCLCRNRFRRTLASSPVDLFSTKNEGQEVGAPVTSAGRRNVFGRRTAGDVSQYQPEPYYMQPGAARGSDDDRLAAGAHAGETDPFGDDDGYLYPGGGGGGGDWSRRGSGASDSAAGSPLSAGGGGGADISLRPMGGSRPASASQPGSANSQTAFLDSQSASSPSYVTATPVSATFGPAAAHGRSPSTGTAAGAAAGRQPPPPRSSSISSSIPSTTVPPYQTPQAVRMTKQMLALANPDDDGSSGGVGPSFMRHRDAGPVVEPEPAAPPPPIEMPPNYDEIEHQRAAARERAESVEPPLDEPERDDGGRHAARSSIELADDDDDGGAHGRRRTQDGPQQLSLAPFPELPSF